MLSRRTTVDETGFLGFHNVALCTMNTFKKSKNFDFGIIYLSVDVFSRKGCTGKSKFNNILILQIEVKTLTTVDETGVDELGM